MPAIRAIGFTPVSFTILPLISTRQAAPSLSPQEFPAVTVPSGFTMGFNLLRISIVVAGLGNSSVSKIKDFFFSLTSTGTISSLKYPASMAAAARLWLSTEKRSCSSRLIPNRSATFSAVFGILRPVPYTDTGWAVVPASMLESTNVIGPSPQRPFRM